MPPHSWYMELMQRERGWLEDLQQNPSGLEKMVAALDAEIPIGKRFESFIRFWLEHGPSFELIASNVQVFRGDRTLGEFDFLCRDRLSGASLHIEAACKYYLGYANRSSWEYWAGPNREDRLSDKMARFTSQFGIEESPEGSATLKRLGIQHCQRLLFLKGMFFHHVDALHRHKSPQCSGSHYRSGWYLFENELEEYFPGGEDWILPERQHWLRTYHTGSPGSQGTKNTINSREATLDNIRRGLLLRKKAVMACRLEKCGNLYQEESRGFILPGIRMRTGSSFITK